MIFWLIAGAMVAASVAFLLWPLTRPETEKTARVDYDLSVYKDQLQELERDRARGILSDAEFDAARTEVERRILALAGDEPPERQRKSAGPLATRVLAGLVAIALPVLALTIYGNLGAPQLPGLPIAERGGGAPVVDVSATVKIIRDLERRLEQNPADVEAWIELGHRRREAATPEEAAAAYREALDLAPGRQDARMGLAESVILINQGSVVPEARQLIAEVLQADPSSPAARYYAGLALVQDGALPQAREVWGELMAATPANAPWREMLQAQLARLEAEMGIAGSEGTAPFAMPDAETQAAVQAMAPEDQAAFVRDNVARLAERLEQEPDNLQGWLMLSRSYGVLGEPQKAREALLKAGTLAQGLPEGAPMRLQVENALRAAGIEP